MKITIGKRTDGDLCITYEILKEAGLNITDELELHISDSMVLMTKKQMSVNDLRSAMNGLMLLGGEFSERANEICAGCDGEDCPYLEDEEDSL